MVEEPEGTFETLLTMLTGIAKTITEGPPPQIERTQHPDGVIVSTIKMYDLDGYETAVIAIVDGDHSHPVERYETEAQARAGHLKWVDLTRDAHHVTQLGYGDMVEPEIKRIR